MDKSAYTPEELGNSILTRLGQGAVGGVGITALYHLLDQARRKKKPLDEDTAAISAGAPITASLAPTAKVANDRDALIGGLLGVAGGGLYGGLRGSFDPAKTRTEKVKNTLRSAIIGAAGGGAVGAGLGYNREGLATLLGNAVPTALIPGTGGDAANVPGDYATPQQKAWHVAANIGALGAGTLGGGALVNSLMGKKKELENKDTVDSAREAYLAALRGDDVKAAQALDTAFERYQEKQSLTFDDVGKALGSVGEYFTSPGGARGDLAAAALLSALGGGVVGGHYMYNKTKSLSRAANLQKAMQSRARLQGLPSVWIDPDELAKTKQLALAQPDAPRLEHNPNVSAHG